MKNSFLGENPFLIKRELNYEIWQKDSEKVSQKDKHLKQDYNIPVVFSSKSKELGIKEAKLFLAK